MSLNQQWSQPSREFSLAPFWFWNDDLSEEEIVRQLDDFKAHGVYAFVIHPRIGLPRSIGWLSERMFHFMRFTVEQAARKDMWVVLYDEGMYPSGSSCGQIVEKNPAFQSRGLVQIDLDAVTPGSRVNRVMIGSDGSPSLAEDQGLVAIVNRQSDNHRIAIVDRPCECYIRGLHYTGEDPSSNAPFTNSIPAWLLYRAGEKTLNSLDYASLIEDTPAAADLLNPEAVECYIELVHQRYYENLGDFFGNTIRAMFTDEPSPLSKCTEKSVVPGTTGILDHVNEILGYDFTPFLPYLWDESTPQGRKYTRDYYSAVRLRFGQTYYKPISKWCQEHNIALTGHPQLPDDIEHLKYFHIPGQDIVWRQVEPCKPSAIEGPASTQAKCASSAMLHCKRRRNANEYCGAFGDSLTFDEMQWLSNWLFVRGCNMLLPHAFYYSMRGIRSAERPPDVGPNSPWWDKYKTYADSCRRLCWLNTDSKHICDIAILGRTDHLPWKAAKVLFQNQLDFNYCSEADIIDKGSVDQSGIQIADMHYKALIIEEEPSKLVQDRIKAMAESGRVIVFDPSSDQQDVIKQLQSLTTKNFEIDRSVPNIRLRHIEKDGDAYFILFNEAGGPSKFRFSPGNESASFLLNQFAGTLEPLNSGVPMHLDKHELRVIKVVCH